MTKLGSARSSARQGYSSPQMQERRRRILAEARALLGESGEKGFGIRALSVRAGVSSRTLYSAFGSKEGILSAAVGEYIEGFREELRARWNSGHLTDIFAEFDAVCEEVATIPAYSRTQIELFYSMTPLQPALVAIRWLPAGRLIRWLDNTPKRDLLPQLDRDWIIDRHVDAELAVFHHWAVGRLQTSALAGGLKRNFVGTLILITKGETRKEFVRLLSAIEPGGTVEPDD